jgi:micrococcal nuclease
MSSRRRNLIVGLILLVAAFLIWLDRSGPRQQWQPQPKSPQQRNAHDFEKYHEKTFTVVKVVDGDTIDIDVPDGKYNHTRIRLLGIDSPETRNERPAVCRLGREAAEFAANTVLGKRVTVYLDEPDRPRGKYGRLLAYVQLPDRSFLNEVLVAQGFAFADSRFRHSFYQKYRQLQAGALRQKKGLWPKLNRDQLPRWLQREQPALLLEK